MFISPNIKKIIKITLRKEIEINYSKNTIKLLQILILIELKLLNIWLTFDSELLSAYDETILSLVLEDTIFVASIIGIDIINSASEVSLVHSAVICSNKKWKLNVPHDLIKKRITNLHRYEIKGRYSKF